METFVLALTVPSELVILAHQMELLFHACARPAFAELTRTPITMKDEALKSRVILPDAVVDPSTVLVLIKVLILLFNVLIADDTFV